MIKKDLILKLNLTEIGFYLKCLAGLIAWFTSYIYFMIIFADVKEPYNVIFTSIGALVVLWVLYKIDEISDKHRKEKK